MRYAAVFFDCDGTIVDTERLIVRLVGELVAERGCAVAARAVHEWVVGVSWAATYRAIGEHLRAHGHQLEDALVATELHARLAPVHFDPALVIAESVTALTRISDLVPVDVVSGSTVAQVERHLSNAGIRHRVRRVLGEECHPAGKPDPAPYLQAAVLAGLPAERCLAVEDSLAGVQSARSAGCDVVALVPGDPDGAVDAASCTALGATVVPSLALLDWPACIQHGLPADVPTA